MTTPHTKETLAGEIQHVESSHPIHDLEIDDLKAKKNLERIDPEVAKYSEPLAVRIAPEENRRLKAMIDRRVLPIMVFTYFLQALDKGTIAFASIMGIMDDAGLKGQQYNWLTTCIYITVLIVEYPTNWIIQRVPVAKYLAFNIISWGAVLACHAACRSFAGLLLVRILLGAFEACCQPAFLIMSSMWYTRAEQAAVVAYWYMMNGGQQIVGGLLAYCFSLIPPGGPIHSWQALFICYGCFTVLYGSFVLYWLPDSPMKARCFSEQDKRLMVERVRANQTGLQNRTFRREQVWEAFRDPQTWAFFMIQVLTSLPTSGLGAFANIIIKGFNFTLFQTQLLAMVLGTVIIIVLMGAVWLDRKTKQPTLIMLLSPLPSIAGTIVLMTVDHTTKGRRIGLLISYYIVLSFWACAALCLSLVSRNVAGQTKKATIVATNFVGWATGNSIGPQVFLARDAPRYFIAFSVHLACYAVLMIVVALLRFHYGRQNRLRAKRLGESGGQAARDAALVHSFEDRTDMENINFVYMR